LAGGVAYASIPDSHGVVHGCYDKKGNLRVSDTGCAGNETPLNWNQSGPSGAQGVTGATGPSGPKGDSGPSGPAGTLTSFDDLAGTSCTSGGVPGTISISYGLAGAVTLRCVPTGTFTTLEVNANADDTNIKVSSVAGISAGGTLVVSYGTADAETVT